MSKKNSTNIAFLIVEQHRSASGHTVDQYRTLLGLGLGKIGKQKQLVDTPSIRGMIDKVKHLVRVK